MSVISRGLGTKGFEPLAPQKEQVMEYGGEARRRGRVFRRSRRAPLPRPKAVNREVPKRRRGDSREEGSLRRFAP